MRAANWPRTWHGARDAEYIYQVINSIKQRMNFEFDAFTIFVFGAMTVIAVFALIGAKQHHDRMQTNGVRVQGVIVRNKIKWGRNTTVRPIVKFVTVEGQTIEAESEYGVAFAIPRYPKGAMVTVLYNRDNPLEFDIVATSNRYI